MAKAVLYASALSTPVLYGAGDWWREAEWYRDVDQCLRSYRYWEPDLDLDGDLRRDRRWDCLWVECRSDQCQGSDWYRP
ncbi:hypothetical protein KIL84_004465 [Mauremys mutica]|uniref:Uncharacterized protein n=1 Tax=Mauremys mutica TaxID=74926 RepID=A0A9D3XN38_9SAUR|nr:hypothetical protein KIL84_004465 [Mauremys mutica]